MYIRTAETHRLAMLNAPEDTVEKFEELLPYAVALGCADAWQKRFDKVLLSGNYTPGWTETDGGMYPYSAALTAVAVSSSAGMAAAAAAAREASGASSGGDSDSSGGSGGSSVGGW